MVAFATSPNAPPKLLVDHVPVGIVRSGSLNALAVAPVLLTTDGMLPLRTPIHRIFCALFEVFFSILRYFYPCGCVAA